MLINHCFPVCMFCLYNHCFILALCSFLHALEHVHFIKCIENVHVKLDITVIEDYVLIIITIEVDRFINYFF